MAATAKKPNEIVFRKPPELGAEPRVESLEELAHAVHWIAWLRHRLKKLKTELEEQVKALTMEASKDAAIQVQGERIAWADYEKAIAEQIEEFVREYHEDLFAEAKTWNCDAGKIESRVQPEKVVCKKDERDIVNKMLESLKLADALERLRTDFPNAFPWLRFDAQLNREGIIAAYHSGTIGKSELKERGLAIERAPEKITIKV